MNLAICIPVRHNLTCFKAMLKGLRVDKGDTMHLLLHVAEVSEEAEVTRIASESGFEFTIASMGYSLPDMAEILNALYCATEGYDWVLFTEQDCFISSNLSGVITALETEGTCIAGPMDTMMYDHHNAKNHPLWGDYGRLSPKPGYFHSSLIFAKRSHIGNDTRPFTIPEGTKLHGYGVLGGESYYGLRINHGQDKSKLMFFRQLHASYGYAADICWPFILHEPKGSTVATIATHLYYSSTKDGYRQQQFLSESEYQWLCSEEKRFLEHYELTRTLGAH